MDAMTRMKGITQGGSLIARLAFFFSRCLYGKVLQPLRVWALDDRPLQAGDRVTQYRKDFFRRYSQVLQVEKVVPSRSLHVLDLSPGAVRINATVSISVEEAIVREATWIEEA